MSPQIDVKEENRMSLVDFYDASANGRKFIQQYETGVDANGNLLAQGEPALTAYDDGSGVWTIRWVHTAGVHPGDVITRAQAEQFFLDDLDNIVNHS